MTADMYHVVIARAGCGKDDDGWMKLPDGRTMNLYLAHDGTSLSVDKVTFLKLVDGVVETRDGRGETFLVSLEDLFAASVSGDDTRGAGRKAGFLG
jgi:hypothetical protein